MTSVSWTQRGAHLAAWFSSSSGSSIEKRAHGEVGTNKGEVQIWDSTQCRKMRTMSQPQRFIQVFRKSSISPKGTLPFRRSPGVDIWAELAQWHGMVSFCEIPTCHRVGSYSDLATGSILLRSTGSRDHHILHRDVRQPAPFMSRPYHQDTTLENLELRVGARSKLHGHRQEAQNLSHESSPVGRFLAAGVAVVVGIVGVAGQVCGLKWSFDEQQLASGGNDNKLCAATLRRSQKLQVALDEGPPAGDSKVWSLKSTEPVLKFNRHQAAVKALWA